MSESVPPHPVLEPYYTVKAERQSFVDDLFDGAARYYNHIGRMLDFGCGPMYRRQALQRAGPEGQIRVRALRLLTLFEESLRREAFGIGPKVRASMYQVRRDQDFRSRRYGEAAHGIGS